MALRRVKAALVDSLAEESAIAAAESLKKAREAEEQARQARHIADSSAFTIMTDNDTTYMANTTGATGASGSKASAAPKKKVAAKPKMTVKEKKERAVSVIAPSMSDPNNLTISQMEIDRIITLLPLEFRGSDPVSLLFLHHLYAPLTIYSGLAQEHGSCDRRPVKRSRQHSQTSVALH